MKRRELKPKSILDLSLGEAEGLFEAMGQPKYRARQVFSWIFEKHVTVWNEMSNLPLELREKVAFEWAIVTSQTEKTQRSKDGTTKLLIRLFDGQATECVLIPEEARNTVCLSTQVGCPIGCLFCASGKGGLVRNLSGGEILEQILHIFSVLPSGDTIRNVVLMGMGEPMKNYENVMRAVRAMNAAWGFGIGARRTTISTVGDIKGIERLSQEKIQVNLAISLHGPEDKTRRKIIPGAKMAPAAAIVEAARNYFAETGRKVTFEYVLVDGVNSAVHHAQRLAQLLRGFPCFVNLITLNSIEGTPLRSPEERAVKRFLHELEARGIPAAVRASRGSDISAACGQLAGERGGRRAARPARQSNEENQ